MKIEIIETGSSGNCFLFDEKVVIDCGLPMSRLSSVDFEKVTHILLTHIHGDHFNTSSLRFIHSNYPHIKFLCGGWLVEPLRIVFANSTSRVISAKIGEVIDADGYKVAPCKAYHDVDNCGWWMMKDGYKHFHITDTYTVEGIDAMDFDSATIECNYDEVEIQKQISVAEEKGEFTHLHRSIRTHLSVQEAIGWCKKNNIKEVVPIHIGSSTKKQVLEYKRKQHEKDKI